MSEDRHAKRIKLDESNLESLERQISPPPSKKESKSQSKHIALESTSPDERDAAVGNFAKGSSASQIQTAESCIRSPFRLTKIQDLPDNSNVDTITLGALLGRENLKEVWLFDYLFDLDFVMYAFHPSIRKKVEVKIIHGSYEESSEQRQHLNITSKHWPNTKIICAHMPERFGTHHSKMMVLFTNENEAQVVIHTANMIPFDWENMTQGVWMSPILPLALKFIQEDTSLNSSQIGTGNRFKIDLLRYLKAYESRTASLVSKLELYDFSAIRAAFLASVPGTVKLSASNPKEYTSFGWLGLREILKVIPPSHISDTIVVQISSVASLGEKWEAHFFGVIRTGSLFQLGRIPSVRILFPTADDIRNSLNGYSSGGSIHMKASGPRNEKQISRLRQMLCQWNPVKSRHDKVDSRGEKNALRGPAAPHIKTFIRFSNDFQSIKWALMTSANLSTQAWGSIPDQHGLFRISSYEVGVLVFPEMYDDVKEMVPIFGKDALDIDISESEKMRIPIRMPYALPPTQYMDSQKPWTRDTSHPEPDIHGRKWV
jgi:tyrosyl-DNA phosphodiesterase-1